MSTPVTAAALTLWLNRTVATSQNTSPASLASQVTIVFQVSHSDSGETASLGEIEQAIHETNTASTSRWAAELLTSRFAFVYRPEPLAEDAGILLGPGFVYIAPPGQQYTIAAIPADGKVLICLADDSETGAEVSLTEPQARALGHGIAHMAGGGSLATTVHDLIARFGADRVTREVSAQTSTV